MHAIPRQTPSGVFKLDTPVADEVMTWPESWLELPKVGCTIASDLSVIPRQKEDQGYDPVSSHIQTFKREAATLSSRYFLIVDEVTLKFWGGCSAVLRIISHKIVLCMSHGSFDSGVIDNRGNSNCHWGCRSDRCPKETERAGEREDQISPDSQILSRRRLTATDCLCSLQRQ